MANTLKKIQTVTVGSGGSATMSFTSIPQTYTDLKIVFSGRSARTASSYDSLVVKFNSTATTYAARRLYGEGGSAGSDTVTTQQGAFSSNSTTANVFGSIEVYIPNYTSSNQKSTSSDSVAENNDSSAYGVQLIASKWDGTGAITQIDLSTGSGSNFMQYTTATLYGVSNVNLGSITSSPYATGGTVTSNGQYYIHTFTSDGTFTPSQTLSCEYLVVAGGGGGGREQAGAGGYRTGTLSVTSGAKTVTIGAGGTGGVSASKQGGNGGNSVFDSITSTGGGGGGGYSGTGNTTGSSGGSGGGGAGGNGSFAGGAGTSGQGFAGGLGRSDGASYRTSGGGGGASAVGVDGAAGPKSGNGGPGLVFYGTAYAGGGGGANYVQADIGLGGSGGGGNGGYFNNQGAAGLANTGGGAGGGGDPYDGRAGGSGIVIVRYTV